mgnify:CR=1 FL=1
MRKQYADLVAETTATAGTGNLTLTQMTGWVRFNDRFATNDRSFYSIRNGNNWEVGLGVYLGSNVLQRASILGTLNAGTWTDGGAALTLAGTSIVRAVAPEYLLNQLPKEEFTPVSGSQAVQDGFVYGVQANSVTLTLPAAPSINDRIVISQAAASITGTIINPNGSKINNVAGNMTVDVDEFYFTLRYISAGYGWKVE